MPITCSKRTEINSGVSFEVVCSFHLLLLQWLKLLDVDVYVLACEKVVVCILLYSQLEDPGVKFRIP